MEKLIKTLVTVFFAVGMAFHVCAASPTIKHIVKQNESIASIAERYGVTESQILELNPDAAQMMYVGMELTVPVVSTTSNTATSTTANPQNAASTVATTVSNTTTPYKVDSFKPSWDLGVNAVIGIPKDNMTMEFSFLGVYNFTEAAYCGVGAGYLGTYYSHSSYEVKFSYITVPIEIGYKLGSSDFAIVPNVGANLNLAVSKSAKYKKDKYDVDGGTFGIFGKAGVKLYIKGWTLGAAYCFPLNDDMKMSVGKDSYLAFSLGVGI